MYTLIANADSAQVVAQGGKPQTKIVVLVGGYSANIKNFGKARQGTFTNSASDDPKRTGLVPSMKDDFTYQIGSGRAQETAFNGLNIVSLLYI